MHNAYFSLIGEPFCCLLAVKLRNPLMGYALFHRHVLDAAVFDDHLDHGGITPIEKSPP
jgi:hypothetical protein